MNVTPDFDPGSIPLDWKAPEKLLEAVCNGYFSGMDSGFAGAPRNDRFFSPFPLFSRLGQFFQRRTAMSDPLRREFFVDGVLAETLP